MTRTLKLNQVPDDVVKLILFPFSLKGAAETWLENEPPCSITTWDDLVSKFLNQFYPHSQTRELRKEIMNFQQVFGETFTEAWERFKYLLRKCPHHEFSLLHQIGFFYNGLSQSDQDSLNIVAVGNLMMRNIQEALTTTKNKARVRTCRNKHQVLSSGGTSTHIDAITALTKQVEALDQSQKDLQESPISVLAAKTTVTRSTSDERNKFPIENNSLSGNPTPSSDSVVESLLLLPTPFKDSESLLEETDTFLSQIDVCFPEYETFCFNIEEKSSGSTTSHSDLSLPDYEVFCFEEKSSGSTTSHSNHSLLEYESFCFDHMKEKSGGNVKIKPDIENMTMNEYLEYEAAKERQLWDDVRSRRSPTNYNEADVDSFHRNKSKTFSYPYSHNLAPSHPCFLPVQPYLKNYLVSTNEGNDVDIENSEEDQEEDNDDGDTFEMWDIMAEDVEQIRKFFNVPDEIDEIVQPLIPKPIHTIPPNDDYVAPATKSNLDELLEEFGDENLNVATIDEDVDLTKDLEELERLLAMRP
ncbi:reverse transcriptase domain-containing protein [Tanacetum coccineum]